MVRSFIIVKKCEQSRRNVYMKFAIMEYYVTKTTILKSMVTWKMFMIYLKEYFGYFG